MYFERSLSICRRVDHIAQNANTGVWDVPKSIPMEDREASGSAHMVLNATVEPEVAILEGMIDCNVSSALPWTLHTCCYSSMDCLLVSLYHYRHGMVC
jgi:hypothetical protein